MNWPYMMDMENLYVFRHNEPMRCVEVKAIPMRHDAIRPTYANMPRGRLLDEIVLNATSEEDLFDTMMRCVSPVGFLGEKRTVESLKDSFLAKRRFFAHLRERAEEHGVSLCQYVTASGTDYSYSIGDVLAAFNLKSVALLSLPAYAAMDFGGAAIPIAPDDPEHASVVMPMHDFAAPGARIYDFDDYFRAFTEGIFAGNNSDLFLTLYGLAYAIDIFVNQIDWSNFRCFEDAISYEPLTRTLNSLVSMGALHSPFDKGLTWKYCPAGIENAEEVAPDLAGTLEIARAMTPLAQLSPDEKPDVIQVFYGLIEHFGSSKRYFGIDFSARFEFPEASKASGSSGDDNGPYMRWEVFTRRYDDALGARAKILRTDEYAEFIPGKDAVPVFNYSQPSGNGGFRMIWALLWDVPETTIESEDGVVITIRGLKQLLQNIDPALADDLEGDCVYGKNGTRMANLSDVEERLDGSPQVLQEISGLLGVGTYSDEARCFPNLEPIYHEGDFAGFGCLAPNGFNRITWFPNRFKCPVVSCLTPGKLSSVDCYVWDLPAQALVDGEGQTHTALGVKQMCEANCPQLLDELESKSFTFCGVSVIPYEVVDDAYSNATGTELRKKSMFQ